MVEIPHFFVDDGFSDSAEIMAIPPRHRLAAVGLWTLCGSWSANKLTDGYVPNEIVKRLGGRTQLVDALVDLACLWTREAGGIRFTNWSKWQRTRDQVKSYRAAQAEKKRKQREAAKTGQSSDDNEPSPGDEPGDEIPCPPGTPQTPIPKPIPNYETHLGSETNVGSAVEPLSAAVSATAWQLVKRNVSEEHPQANRTDLALQANELLTAGTEPQLVEAALVMWNNKPGRGPKILRHLVSDVIRERGQPLVVNGARLQGADLKAAEYQALKAEFRERQP